MELNRKLNKNKKKLILASVYGSIKSSQNKLISQRYMKSDTYPKRKKLENVDKFNETHGTPFSQIKFITPKIVI